MYDVAVQVANRWAEKVNNNDDDNYSQKEDHRILDKTLSLGIILWSHNEFIPL